MWPPCIRHPRRLVPPAALALMTLLLPAALRAQARGVGWEIDPTTSIVWWQVDPHYNHLWATTCPEDPSWQAGEGRSPDYRYVMDPGYTDAGRGAGRIPLYPRGPVRALCRTAVRGTVTVSDTVGWQGVSGTVVVLADSLVTGLNIRDAYARRWLLETQQYPEIRFRLDSLTGVERGDTLRATAHGVFEVREVPMPVAVPVRAWPEPEGLRVIGQTSFPATDLVHRFGMSRLRLGLGVVMKRWNTMHWGFDLLLIRPDQP